MKTIKIFLASSDELAEEREKFGNLIRQLDEIFLKRGIHVQLLVWEDMDPSYNNCRKQDEYNAWIRESQIFVALFYTRAGQYTLEEWEVARKENKRRKEPKLMVYCRTLQAGEVEEQNLTDFKQEMDKKWKHYWCKYTTTDNLHLHFAMYFLRNFTGAFDALKVENGQVKLDTLTVASMDNQPFAKENKDYQRISAELLTLPGEIEGVRQFLDKFPDNDYMHGELQKKLNRYNSLQEEFTRLQKTLFETSRHIATMQRDQLSDKLRRATEAFEKGNLERANTLLDEIINGADSDFGELKNVLKPYHQKIEALLFRAKTVMADVNLLIADRIKRVAEIYAKADRWAKDSALPDEKYEGLLDDYAEFLYDYGLYKEAKPIYLRLISLREALYGSDHPDTATSYNNIGVVYYCQGDYPKALEYYFKALAIREKVLGLEHPDTAESYNNIGLVYHNQGDYPKALEYHSRALAIYEKVLGLKHPSTATSYNNIGGVYDSQGDYPKALEYYSKALAIREKVLELEHPDTATSYNNIGAVYDSQGDYPKALEYYFKALTIREKVLGQEHPSTATSYNNIGGVYYSQGDYPKALEYYFKDLAICEKKLGADHPYTITVRENIEYVKSR